MQKWFINCIISTTNKLIWQFHQRRPNAPFSNRHDSVYCMPFITQLASKHSTLSRAVSQYLHGILQKHSYTLSSTHNSTCCSWNIWAGYNRVHWFRHGSNTYLTSLFHHCRWKIIHIIKSSNNNNFPPNINSGCHCNPMGICQIRNFFPLVGWWIIALNTLKTGMPILSVIKMRSSRTTAQWLARPVSIDVNCSIYYRLDSIYKWFVQYYLLIRIITPSNDIELFIE